MDATFASTIWGLFNVHTQSLQNDFPAIPPNGFEMSSTLLRCSCLSRCLSPIIAYLDRIILSNCPVNETKQNTSKRYSSSQEALAWKSSRESCSAAMRNSTRLVYLDFNHLPPCHPMMHCSHRPLNCLHQSMSCPWLSATKRSICSVRFFFRTFITIFICKTIRVGNISIPCIDYSAAC
ncbi:uncharacterized protein K441DRAFT_283006 [Cenococcum geophilum 1.58]|uniref:uncharacterized protein n=1 Tax=Cenococcum geophilum 1.58 TaxID=794803 RepID=UPI00358F1BBE|nr:hypothetical protein K441DRAFT_283006 [Cenococcum geophilum 1.58]